MGPKNIILIVMAISIVAGAFVFAEFRNNQLKKVVYDAPIATGNNDELSSAALSDYSLKDTDADDLKDWEEVLLGTDPRKADTDADGTPDGKEANSGRNPLVKSSNDGMRNTSVSTSTKANLTPTDKLARDFFARYMELNQLGLAKDAQSQQELVGQVLKNGLVLEIPKSFTLKDIKISPDSSKEYATRYGNLLGAVFNNNQILGRDEAVIAKESLEKEEPEILREIDPIISAYKKIVEGLLKISAPANAASVHLGIVNSVSKFLFIAESFRKSDVDALKGLQAASGYLDAGKSLIDSLQAMKKYLSSLNISYAPNEPGNMFFR